MLDAVTLSALQGTSSGTLPTGVATNPLISTTGQPAADTNGGTYQNGPPKLPMFAGAGGKAYYVWP